MGVNRAPHSANAQSGEHSDKGSLALSDIENYVSKCNAAHFHKAIGCPCIRDESTETSEHIHRQGMVMVHEGDGIRDLLWVGYVANGPAV